MSDHETAPQVDYGVNYAAMLRFSLDVLAARVLRVLTLVLSFTGVVLVLARPHWISLAAYGLFVTATLPVWWRKEQR